MKYHDHEVEFIVVSEILETPVINEPDTPLARDVLGNLARFPHCILLTRVGQFYEVSLL